MHAQSRTFPAIISFLTAMAAVSAAGTLEQEFASPPESCRPGVYWYFMDGNLSREGMTRDLEAMKEAGLGCLVFLEVNVGVARGPVDFLSERWQDLFVHAVREAERLGISITLGAGPGWTGSGGPWVRPEQSMQHLVASRLEVQGPGPFNDKLSVPPPRRPFFGDVPDRLRKDWEGFYKDVAVLAFPTPAAAARIPDIDEKALYYRAPFSSQPGVKPILDAPAEYPPTPAGSAIAVDQILDLTSRLRPDGTLDWKIPEGRWTVMRFVSRNNGATTRPAPEPGIGFECDKLDAACLDSHLEQYVGRLLAKVGPVKKDNGWTTLHMDSWEMGSQNWTPRLREEFMNRRGYDPLPYYPTYLGDVVVGQEITERFLWDLRETAGELVIQNHAEHLKAFGRRHGLALSIEPYDMNPTCDFDLGAVADVPMAEFWSVGFNTTFSCHEASSIAHVMGRPVVAAEAFTGAPGEDWRMYPASLKNQGDWAFCTGINRFMFHTFAHKPDEGRPGMVMGPYGVHWDRGQTWWPMVGTYHRYISRCQTMLRQGRTVADILYLMPEGAPNVFQPPGSAFEGSAVLPDRRSYNFDGCSAKALVQLATVRDGQVVFPGGGSYHILVLPNSVAMTPGLIAKLEELVGAGATVVGCPPKKSPSLVGYPGCDMDVRRRAEVLWGALTVPEGRTTRSCGKGRVIWGGDISPLLSGQAMAHPAYETTGQILTQMGLPEDFVCSGPVRYTHRTTEDREIYFVANRSDQPVQAAATFRVSGRQPELWDPQTGAVRLLPDLRSGQGLTTIPLRFEAFESFFVVFPRPGAEVTKAAKARANFPSAEAVSHLEGAWEVAFDPNLGGPRQVRFETLEDWTQRPEPGIRYYSGIATYRRTFDLPEALRRQGRHPVWLDLGEVQAMARVRVNGKDCGVAWTAPWRVDISNAVRDRDNHIEIEIANLWPNRMIGDAASSDKAYTQTTYRPCKASDPLLPSGLLGPVRLVELRYPE